MVCKKINYSRTFCKRPPKIQRLSGRLREVVAYNNRTGGGHLPRSGVGTSILWKIIYCMQFLS